jgi:hypothetical protein
MQRTSTTRGGARARKSSGRLRTFLWIAATAALVIGLLYFEQTAMLYLLATLGLTALLVAVALSDLSGSQRVTGEAELGNDAAAIGSGIAGVAPNAPATATTTAAARRPAKRRKS